MNDAQVQEIYRDAATSVIVNGLKSATFPLPRDNSVKIIFHKTPLTKDEYAKFRALVDLLEDSVCGEAKGANPQ